MCLEKEKERNISGQNITEGQKKKHQKNPVQTKTGHYSNYNNCKNRLFEKSLYSSGTHHN